MTVSLHNNRLAPEQNALDTKKEIFRIQNFIFRRDRSCNTYVLGRHLQTFHSPQWNRTQKIRYIVGCGKVNALRGPLPSKCTCQSCKTAPRVASANRNCSYVYVCWSKTTFVPVCEPAYHIILTRGTSYLPVNNLKPAACLVEYL